jgi:shikimate kinase
MKKVALIGMMGSGKSTIARLLSEKTGVPFRCTDEMVEHKMNTTISEIFETRGESYFRKVEKEVLFQLAEMDPVILSTGGGIVLDPENINHLKEKGFVIIYLNRSLERTKMNLKTENRPLLREDPNRVNKIYDERSTLYKTSCHVVINNDGTAESAAERLAKLLMEWR